MNGSPEPICQVASGGSSDHGVPSRARREKNPREQEVTDRRLELESVLRGILFVFICVFTLPVIVAVFVLTAALLNLGQGTSTYMTFPDNYWKSLLSFAFRISLIPGIVYLISRGLRRLRDRRGEKRLALIFASLMLFTVLIVMPPKPEERVTFSGAELKPRLTKQVIYRPENRKARAADKKGPINGLTLQRS